MQIQTSSCFRNLQKAPGLTAARAPRATPACFEHSKSVRDSATFRTKSPLKTGITDSSAGERMNGKEQLQACSDVQSHERYLHGERGTCTALRSSMVNNSTASSQTVPYLMLKSPIPKPYSSSIFSSIMIKYYPMLP